MNCESLAVFNNIVEKLVEKTFFKQLRAQHHKSFS